MVHRCRVEKYFHLYVLFAGRLQRWGANCLFGGRWHKPRRELVHWLTDLRSLRPDLAFRNSWLQVSAAPQPRPSPVCGPCLPGLGFVLRQALRRGGKRDRRPSSFPFYQLTPEKETASFPVTLAKKPQKQPKSRRGTTLSACLGSHVRV